MNSFMKIGLIWFTAALVHIAAMAVDKAAEKVREKSMDVYDELAWELTEKEYREMAHIKMNENT